MIGQAKNGEKYTVGCLDPACEQLGCQIRVYLQNLLDRRESPDYPQRRDDLIKRAKELGCDTDFFSIIGT